MNRLRILILSAAVLAPLTVTRSHAQDYGLRPLRFGNTSGWYYDGRDDDRDAPTNGFFPGNFAADPLSAATGGVSGFLDSNPWRSARPYPSQVVIGTSPSRNDCAQRHRSYDPASGTFLGKDGLRHRC